MSETNGTMELEQLAAELPTNTTDWPTRLAMARDLLNATVEAPEPEPQPAKVDSTPKPKLPKYVLQRPCHRRLHDWLLVQVTQSRRIVRWLAWWVALPWKAASFVRVVTSGQVKDPYAVAERDEVCEECDQRYVFVRIGGETSEHCQACKCPPTRWSENAYRNTLAGWHCPLRKHAGPYPNDGQAGALKGLGYEESAVLSAVGGGCVGCGCGKAGK